MKICAILLSPATTLHRPRTICNHDIKNSTAFINVSLAFPATRTHKRIQGWGIHTGQRLSSPAQTRKCYKKRSKPATARTLNATIQETPRYGKAQEHSTAASQKQILPWFSCSCTGQTTTPLKLIDYSDNRDLCGKNGHNPEREAKPMENAS